MKNKMLFTAVCLLLCLSVTACQDSSSNEDNTPTDNEETRIAINFTTDTYEDDLETDPVTDTEELADTEPFEVEDTLPTIETDAVTEPAPETDDVTVPETELPENVTADTTPSEDMEVIDVFGALSAGNPISGQITSKESDKINLTVKYNCRTEADGVVVIGLEVGLETYGINCGARDNMGIISVNGQAHKFSTDAISYDGNTKTYIPFTVYTFQSEDGKTYADVDVSWAFNGNYAGTKIDALTAKARLSWGLPY